MDTLVIISKVVRGFVDCVRPGRFIFSMMAGCYLNGSSYEIIFVPLSTGTRLPLQAADVAGMFP